MGGCDAWHDTVACIAMPSSVATGVDAPGHGAGHTRDQQGHARRTLRCCQQPATRPSRSTRRKIYGRTRHFLTPIHPAPLTRERKKRTLCTDLQHFHGMLWMSNADTAKRGLTIVHDSIDSVQLALVHFEQCRINSSPWSCRPEHAGGRAPGLLASLHIRDRCESADRHAKTHAAYPC